MRAGLFTVGAVLGTGCLLPQENDVLEEILAPNHPPRILEESADPHAAEGRVPLGGDGCKQTFSAPVEDPDVNDQVIYRWYLDYDPVSNNRPIDEIVAGNTGRALRDRASYTVTNGPQTFGAAGTHVVTLMVHDGFLVQGDGPGSVPREDPIPGVPDAGIKRYATTHSWIVETDPLLPCPEGVQ